MSKQFQKFLTKYGWYVPPPKCYPDFSYSVPDKTKLIDVPPSDTEFIPSSISEIHLDNRKANYLASAFQQFVVPEQQTPSDNSKYLSPCFQEHSVLIETKSKIRTYLHEKSSELDFPFDVCEEPSCLNSAVYGFNYCYGHLLLDPKKTIFPSLSRCTAKIANKQTCQNPAFFNDKFCCLHRKT